MNAPRDVERQRAESVNNAESPTATHAKTIAVKIAALVRSIACSSTKAERPEKGDRVGNGERTILDIQAACPF